MIRRILISGVLFALIFSCNSLKSNVKQELKYTFNDDDFIETQYFDSIVDQIKSDSLSFKSTDFYNIRLKATLAKKTYNLNENKNFNLCIINFGTKNLYLPEWFRRDETKHQELFIEIYKKEKRGFIPYIQKRIKTKTTVQPKITERLVLSTSNGKSIYYENIEIDRYLKIVDDGIYFIKINLDLSNFGYFKNLTTVSSEFEIIN